MSWVDSYDNAERTLFYSNDKKLSTGRKVLSFIDGFCSVVIAGKSFMETMPTPVNLANNTGVAGLVDEGEVTRSVNKFIGLQFVETDAPQYYNPSDEKIPLFAKYDGV